MVSLLPLNAVAVVTAVSANYSLPSSIDDLLFQSPAHLAAEEYDRKAKVLVDGLKVLEQREMPVEHRFQTGAYLREIFMPADTFVIGAKHRGDHFNIVLSGRAKVLMAGQMHDIEAGAVFQSGAGVQKLLYVMEDMRWITVHANPGDSRDVAALEEIIAELPEDILSAKGSLTLDEHRMAFTRALTA